MHYVCHKKMKNAYKILLEVTMEQINWETQYTSE